MTDPIGEKRFDIAKLLGVDEVATEPVAGIGIVIKVRVGTLWFAERVKFGDLSSNRQAAALGEAFGNLAKRALSSPEGVRAIIDKIDRQAAATYGMPLDVLAPRLEDGVEPRCEYCGHTAMMHGRGAGLECTIWGCDCPQIMPGSSPSVLALARRIAGVSEFKEAEKKPMTRFDAVVAEMEKEKKTDAG